MNGISPWLCAKVVPADDVLPILYKKSIGNQILSTQHKLCFGYDHQLMAQQTVQYQPRQTS